MVLAPDKVDVPSRKVVMFGSWICQPVSCLNLDFGLNF